MDTISAAEARLLGLRRYFSGKACPKGHVSERFVSTMTCITCLSARKKKRDPEKRAAARRRARARKQALPGYVKKKGGPPVRFTPEELVERARTRARAYYLANREICRIRKKAWYAANPGKLRAMRAAHRRTRRARKKGARGTVSAAAEMKLIKAQKGLCAACHRPFGPNFHRDHVMPLALGGQHEINNLQLLCPPCNLSKGAKHPADWWPTIAFR